MKRKHLTVMAIIAIITLSVFVLSCDDEEDDPPVDNPQPQEYQVNDMFSGATSVRFIGTFTDTEWTSIRDQVKNKLNTAYNSDSINLGQRAGIATAFNNATVTIEKTSTYTLYKTIASNSNSIFININGLSGLTSEKLLEMSNAIGTDKNG